MKKLPYRSVIRAWRGDQVAGDQNTVWNYGKIQKSRDHVKCGDIVLNLGYNFIHKENGYVGIALRGIFGAEGVSKAEYLFEPVFGHVGRMGLGSMIDAQIDLYKLHKAKALTFTFAGYVEHFFANNQMRSFDIVGCGAGSRYNMIKKLTTIGATNAIYSGLDNAINQCTQRAKIGIGVVYDATLQLSYLVKNVNVDLGYSMRGRSKEAFSRFVTHVTPDTFILYATGIADVNTPLQTVGVNKVTIAGNTTDSVPSLITKANQNNYTLSTVGTLSLDIESALAPAVLTHTLYINCGYSWNKIRLEPSISFFVQVEFSHNNHSFSKRGIGVQGHVAY